MTPAEPSEPSEPGRPIIYAVRFTPEAENEALEAAARYAVLVSDRERGREWYASLKDAVGTLATNPTRLAVRERESRLLGRTVRALLHRHTPGSRTAAAACHAFYTVRDDSPDGPRVSVIHVRHAARRPLTRGEARSIENKG